MITPGSRHSADLSLVALFLIATAGLGLSGCSRQRTEYRPSATPDAWTGPTRRYQAVDIDVHEIHAEIAERDGCQVCHHEIAETTSDLVAWPDSPQACGQCHSASRFKPDRVTATHQTCRTCHTNQRRINPQSITPVECLECHQERI